MDKSRILIVDDIEENLKVLTETLTREGFYPLQAKNGERCIQIAEKALPDLILLDIQMPGLDGYETLERLKSKEATNSIPVIFLSALNQIEDKIRGFQAGAVDYISKPFQKEEVIARVSTHLNLRKAQRDVEIEKEKSDALLRSILPQAVADELKEKGSSLPQKFENVTILFSDIVDFTSSTADMDPIILIEELNNLFTEFDNIIERNGCERIKTIGDAYLAVCGVPLYREDHAIRLTNAAKDILSYLNKKNTESEIKWKVRIGIHSGEIVAGIVGRRKYLYDIFGDSVNIASRMESNSLPMRINISEETYNLVKDRIKCSKREEIEVKGKGLTTMYFVE